jgi:energy-coupling factor transporter ATP-binding protein EcfA2
MKLHQVRVQNYRSIVDSGIITVDERVTVIVGKNEQGKTNFLRALESFNPSYTYLPKDLPNHLRPALETKDAKGISIVTLWLLPEPSDRLKEVIPEIEKVRRFEVTKYYDGHYENKKIEMALEGAAEVTSEILFAKPDLKPIIDQMLQQAEMLREKFQVHSKRLPPFAASLAQAGAHVDQFIKADFTDYAQIGNIINTFTTALKGLPNQDLAIQTDIANLITDLQARESAIQDLLGKNPLSAFTHRIPHFVFHSSLDKIPAEVNIAAFVADPDKTSKGMANLCKVAGLSMQKIKELASSPDTSTRRPFEDYYHRSVTGGINEYWTQETYNVEFRIEKDTLSVAVSDSSYSPRIPPSDRSEGFQWYLSFYCALLAESTTDPTVLLLDNPGLELHSDGQRDIKRFLEEKMASTQIIYVTHSPSMIDTNNLEQVRKVELMKDLEGTKITELNIAPDGVDLLEPVRSAIGAKLINSLIVNDFNVLVEGAADKPILDATFTLMFPEKAPKILVNGSVAERKFLPRFYQQVGLPFLVYVDADSGGRDLAAELKKSGIANEKIFSLDTVFKSEDLGFEAGKDFEIEDVMSTEFYDLAVRETYPDRPVAKPTNQQGKRTNYYEKAFTETHKIGFNKRKVATSAKKMLVEGKADSETKERLSKLISAILKTLEEQTKNTSGGT